MSDDGDDDDARDVAPPPLDPANIPPPASRRLVFRYNQHHIARASDDDPIAGWRAHPPAPHVALAPPLPNMIRGVVLSDGSVKAVFKDNVVLCLDPTGAAVTIHAPGDPAQGAFYLTLVPIRPRRRGERRSLRTFSPGASLRSSLAFNPRPRRL